MCHWTGWWDTLLLPQGSHTEDHVLDQKHGFASMHVTKTGRGSLSQGEDRREHTFAECEGQGLRWVLDGPS